MRMHSSRTNGDEESMEEPAVELNQCVSMKPHITFWGDVVPE